jgi:hypothetical protein
VLDKKWKIYQRREVVMEADRLKFPAVFAPSSNKPIGEPVRGVAETKIPALAEKIFLDDYAPTFAVIDDELPAGLCPRPDWKIPGDCLRATEPEYLGNGPRRTESRVGFSNISRQPPKRKRVVREGYVSSMTMVSRQ